MIIDILDEAKDDIINGVDICSEQIYAAGRACFGTGCRTL